ncbi:MAG: lipid-A-disaccharide synthase [Betaproteobacteria bacterium]|nr:lipid-A-disaccharide synthase [Betaproteobacteria bacterium]NBT74502.1 lipid-A-disaccharide synthase [Betaproteobacteria bacterium]NBY13754.1 lipid-A-disaccharide synthase [Betaproteobacteria bacterium]NCA16553.1 lipid-A-disaccharide synthase [Betaproteobacteria bacterium]
MAPERLALVAGEASGDLIAAQSLGQLLRARSSRGGSLALEGIGGSHLRALGMDCWHDAQRLAVRGYLEALSRLGSILAIRRDVRARLISRPPRLFLGVDAPDFNLTLEASLRREGIPTVHLVSPSIWAWRPERLRRIAEAVDHMLCLFPFEPDCYRETRVQAHYVGHPLADLIPEAPDRGQARELLGMAASARPILAVLPGSRDSEIRLVGEAFLGAACVLADRFEVLIPLASEELGPRLKALKSWPRAQQRGVRLVGPVLPESCQVGRPISHLVLQACEAALVASGTATLEAALFKRPQVIGYRVPALTYRMMRNKALVSRIGLPNLLVHPDLVPELVQDDCEAVALARALESFVCDAARVQRYENECRALHERLKCNTASRVATILDGLLK